MTFSTESKREPGGMAAYLISSSFSSFLGGAIALFGGESAVLINRVGFVSGDAGGESVRRDRGEAGGVRAGDAADLSAGVGEVTSSCVGVGVLM